MRTCCMLLIVVTTCITKAVSQENLVGHLKPFGYQKPPSVPVTEFSKENAPRPPEFFKKYVKSSRPVIFRGAVLDSAAYRKWTDAYVRANFGEMEVRLEAKKEKRHLPPVGEKYLGRDTLRHFADTYHEEGNDVYIVSDLPSTMYKDMGVIPSFGACGEMAKRMIEIDIWWSGGGASSIIHKDEFHQINCLLNGTKHWKLIDSKYEKDIYKFPEGELELGGFSEIDATKVDLKKFPKVSNVEWSNITVYAGDCLFLPKSYYHQVESEGTNNKAVSILFARFDHVDSLDFSDCTDDTNYKSLKSLADFKVMWEWIGKGKLVMGRLDLEEGLKKVLLIVIERAKMMGKRVDENVWREIIGKHSIFDGLSPEAIHAFPLVDKTGDGYLCEEDIDNLNLEELRKISYKIEAYEPSSSYNFEYSMISFDRVWALANILFRRFPVLKKETWLKNYLKSGGTASFGTEIFSRIAGDKTEIISAEVSDEILYDALENWVKYWAPQYSGLEEKPVDLSMKRDWFENGLQEMINTGDIESLKKEWNKPSDESSNIREEL